jgi:hypothetical protein
VGVSRSWRTSYTKSAAFTTDGFPRAPAYYTPQSRSVSRRTVPGSAPPERTPDRAGGGRSTDLSRLMLRSSPASSRLARRVGQRVLAPCVASDGCVRASTSELRGRVHGLRARRMLPRARVGSCGVRRLRDGGRCAGTRRPIRGSARDFDLACPPPPPIPGPFSPPAGAGHQALGRACRAGTAA